MPGVCPDCMGQEQGKEETPAPRDQLEHVPSSSGSAPHTGEDEVITSMKLISLLSLKRSLTTTQVSERQMWLLALDESPLAFTPWYITVVLNGRPKINVPQ